jgi:membrane associated rhomboid family serine protease
MTRRPPAPRFWRNIAPALKAARPSTRKDRPRLWELVLQAKGIPYRLFTAAALLALYVPPVAALAALREITAFETEKPPSPPPPLPERPGCYWFIALLAALIPWHSLRWDGFPALSFSPASAQAWLDLGGLDAYRVSAAGELWRAVTALTMHADGAHLASNLVTGALFGIPLCRYTGVGLGFFLTILAGALGNIATACLRPASSVSQGFSTAVFASVGLLAAFAAVYAARSAGSELPPLPDGRARNHDRAALRRGFLHGLLPIGAGLALLAMLGGSDAPGVDYLAHALGLASGLVLGLALALCAPGLLTARGRKDAALQILSLAAAFGLIASSWVAAVSG